MLKLRLPRTVIFLVSLTQSAAAVAPFPNIFGRVDREPVPASHPLAGQVGRITSSAGSCAVVLVGKDVALTARHCVEDANKKIPWPLHLAFGMGNLNQVPARQRTEAAAVWRGGGGQAGDWAVMITKDALGARFGYLTVGGAATEGQSIELHGPGITRHQVLYTEEGCRVRKVLKQDGKKTGIIYHDCDDVRGDSGSPLAACQAGKCSLVGLNRGEKRTGESSVFRHEYSDEFANIAVSTQMFAHRIRQATTEAKPLACVAATANGTYVLVNQNREIVGSSVHGFKNKSSCQNLIDNRKDDLVCAWSGNTYIAAKISDEKPILGNFQGYKGGYEDEKKCFESIAFQKHQLVCLWNGFENGGYAVYHHNGRAITAGSNITEGRARYGFEKLTQCQGTIRASAGTKVCGWSGKLNVLVEVSSGKTVKTYENTSQGYQACLADSGKN